MPGETLQWSQFIFGQWRGWVTRVNRGNNVQVCTRGIASCFSLISLNFPKRYPFASIPLVPPALSDQRSICILLASITLRTDVHGRKGTFIEKNLQCKWGFNMRSVENKLYFKELHFHSFYNWHLALIVVSVFKQWNYHNMTNIGVLILHFSPHLLLQHHTYCWCFSKMTF